MYRTGGVNSNSCENKTTQSSSENAQHSSKNYKIVQEEK